MSRTAARPERVSGPARLRAAHRRAWAPVLAATWLVAACAGGGGGDAETAIREVTRRWEEALVSGDPAGAVESVFTADAIRLPANEPAVRGFEAIRGALAGSIALEEARFDLEDIEVSGSLAYASGTYRVRVPQGQTIVGKFLEVWKRTPAGWRIHRVMWD